MDEIELIKQAQHGSTVAFGNLYDAYAGRIFRFVHIKVKNQQQAEDILQESFIKTWRALPHFDPKNGNFSAWLYKIAANTTNDHFRKIYRKPETLELNDKLDVASNINSAEDIARQSDMENVKSVFPLLPLAYRQILELRFIQDFTIKETANILGKTQLAVRLSQHRALKKLRELVSKKYVIKPTKI